MESGQELGPADQRRSWRLLRRLGRLIDPASVDALSDVEQSLRTRVPRDAPRVRRLGAEVLDSFHEGSASFSALVRGLATGDSIERLVAADYLQTLALKELQLAAELAEALSTDADSVVAACALNELNLIRAAQHCD